jgi:hypothetical protein
MPVNVKGLMDSFYHFISGVYASFAEDNFFVESMTIKGDKVYVQYKTAGSSQGGANERAVTLSGLRILSVRDRKVMEQLNTVYQVKTSSDLG